MECHRPSYKKWGRSGNFIGGHRRGPAKCLMLNKHLKLTRHNSTPVRARRKLEGHRHLRTEGQRGKMPGVLGKTAGSTASKE